jgi:hypothetical protein
MDNRVFLKFIYDLNQMVQDFDADNVNRTKISHYISEYAKGRTISVVGLNKFAIPKTIDFC